MVTMKKRSTLLTLVAIALLSTIVSASHFRGGIIWLRPQSGGSQTAMEISYHVSWRRSFGSLGCDANTIANQILNSGAGSMTCLSGCSGTITQMSFLCTDFSAQEDWTFGFRELVHDFTGLSGTITVGFTGGCWISPLGCSWRLTTTFSLTPRSDNGEINSTPRATTSPVIRLQQGCTHTISLAVTDPDGDTIRCRWASGSSECGDICSAFPGAVLDSTTCTISYTANRGAGYKAAAIMVEDFLPGSSQPLSSVGLQFLVLVISSSNPCAAAPAFVSPTLSQGSCVELPLFSTFTTQPTASSSIGISSIDTISPLGTSKGSVQQIAGTNNYYVNIMWTPSINQHNQTHLLCYSAVDTNGASSPQICISIYAGSSKPVPTAVMPNHAELQVSNNTWIVTFDKPLRRLTTTAYITFRDSDTNELLYQIDVSQSLEVTFVSNQISITPNYIFPIYRSVYVTLDGGVVQGAVGCEGVNEPVQGIGFWNFTTVKPPLPEFEVTETYDSTVGQGDVKCIQFNLPSGISGITIQLNVVNNGMAVLYASNFNDRPNATVHDVMLETSGWEDTFINISQLNPLGNPNELYVCIEGVSGNSNIQVSVDIGDTSTEPVTVTQLPSALTEYYGSSFSVECIVTGKPTPQVSWSFNGTSFTQLTGVVIQTVQINNNILRSELVFTAVSNAHKGVYTCAGTNTLPNGTVTQSSTFSLEINGFIAINLVGQALSATSIRLDWDLLPIPELTSLLSHYLVNCDELETFRNWTFFAVNNYATILSLHPYYSYSCRVAIVTTMTNPYTTPITIVTYESIPTGPPLNPYPSALNPHSVNMSWYPPALEHQNGKIIYYIINFTEVETGSTAQYTSNNTWLLLVSLHPHYNYIFTFAAVTAVGEGPAGSITTITTPEDAPTAAPSGLNGYDVDSTSIFLSWLPPPVQHHNGIIRMYTINLYEVETGITITTTSLNTSAVVSSLHANYNYTVTVSAVTVSPGPFSTSVNIQTPEDIPGGVPGNFTAQATSPYSVVLSWNPPLLEDQNGDITGYVINVTVLETGATFLLYANTNSLVVSSLKPYRTYVCIIAAQTSVGTGPFGIQFVLQTPSDAPSAPPALPTSSSVTSNGFTISWAPPGSEFQNGVILYYVIRITVIETGNTFEYNSTSTSFSLQSLHPAYTYECRIAAYTVGLGPFSSPFTVTTAEEAPTSAPENFSQLSSTSTSIVLSWAPPPPEHQNGVITFYQLNLTLLGTGEVFQYTTTMTTITVTNLQPFTAYSCVIAAHTAVGQGPFTTVLSIITPEDAPSSAPTFTASFSVDASTVALQWSPPPPDTHNGIVRKYIVNATAVQTGVSTLTNITGTTGIIVSLIPSFTYTFSVSAFTVSAGPYSAEVTISLPEDAPRGFPRDVTGTSSSPYSIYLSWSEPPIEEQSGTIVQYVVNVTHAGTLLTVQYFTVNTFINITNLQPFTTYICVVAAQTAIGTGPFSHLFFIQTQESAPSLSPQHASGVSGGPNTIHLAWDPPPLEHHNGEIDNYRINVTEAETGLLFQLITNQTQITINNLHPFYTYHCYVTAITVGEGPYTDAVTIITDEDAPSAGPVSVSTSVGSSRSTFIQWSPPPASTINGIIREYSVTLTNTQTAAMSSYSTISTSINITDLNPYTTYTCRVVAVTVAAGPSSSPVTFTTHQDVPSSPPELFNASASSSTELLLQWSSPILSAVNGIIQHYSVLVLEQDTNVVLHSTTTTNSQILLSNLHPYYVYMCSVSAFTIGSGPSASISFQMPEDAPASAPTTIEAESITSVSAEISWDPLPTEDENGLIRSYIINVTELETGSSFQLTTSVEFAILSNLHPAYTYVLSLAAITISEGPYSQPYIVQTLEDAPASAPTAVNVTIISPASVQVNWSPPPTEDHNGVITAFTVEITDTKTDIVFVITETGYMSLVDSLDPFTTYECRVAANTSVGMGPYSTTLVFQTVEDAPSAPPQYINLVASSSTSLDVSWLPPLEEYQNGIVRLYTVRVVEVETNTVSFYNTTENSIEVTSLHPHYLYVVSIAAVTVAQGPYSNNITIRTPEDAPSGPPTAINVTSLSSTTLGITWSPPLDAHVNGIVKYYVVNVSISETQERLQYQTSSTSLTLANLHPYYFHTVIISAVTVGPGPFSGEYTVRLPEDAPSAAPLNISVNVLSSTSVQLSWSPPHLMHQNGLIQSYSILVHEQPTNSTTLTQQSFQHNSIVITSLHPNYDYTLSVAAHTVGLGPYGSVTARTHQDAPNGSPLNLSTLITSSSSVTLQWSPPEIHLQNGLIQHYTVQLTEAQTGVLLQYTSSGVSLTINNLHPYYTYTCTVAAVTTAAGPGITVNFQLPQDVPTGAPLNVSVTPLNATSLYVNWKPPLTPLQNGVVTGYNVLLNEMETASTQIVPSVAGLFVVVTDLHPNYHYEVQVAAITIGLGPYSNGVNTQLPVASPSGSPTSVSGASSSPYSITISWTTPAPGLLNGDVTGFLINVTHANNLNTVQYTSDTTTITISSLDPFTTYICVVAAETSAGTGPFSNLILVQTQETAPSAAPEHASGIPVGSTSIHLTWDPPPLGHQNGIIREYLVNITEEDSDFFSQNSTDQTQITIYNLVPHRLYTCYIAAVTIAVGPYTGEIQVTTDIDAPGGPPLNLSSSLTSSTSVLLRWAPPQADLQNGIIRHYTIKLEETETGIETEYTSEETHLVIEGLHPYYTYTTTISAVTVASGPEAVLSFQLPQDVPSGAPQNVSVSPVNATALVVSWLPPAPQFQNGLVNEYHINITEVETGLMATLSVGMATQQQTLSNLHPYYSYRVTVAAVTIGTGPYSNEVTQQLPESIPNAAPSNFIGEVTGNTTVHLVWSALPDDQLNGQFQGYTLTCSNQYEHSLTVQVSGISITLADLQINSHYTCLVCTSTSVGCGPSAVTYVSTYDNSPIGPPQSKIENITSTSATIMWFAPFDPTNSIESYAISIQLIHTSTSLTVPRPAVTITNIQGNSMTIQPLLESSEYRIVVYAVTSSGTSPGSKPVTVTTPTSGPNSPNNFTCVPTSSTVLRCTWDPPNLPPDYSVTGYFLQYKLADGFDYYPHYGVLREIILDHSMPLSTIEGLQPYGGYLVALNTMISYEPSSSALGSGLMNDSFNSFEITQTSTVNTTLPISPESPVQSLTTNITSPTSLLLSWLPPDRIHWRGQIEHYLITAVSEGSAERMKRQEPSSVITREVEPQANHRDPSLATEPLKPETFELQGLEEYFTYSISVSLVNGAGAGEQSPPILQNLPAAAPSGPPVNVTYTGTSLSLTVTWSAPSPLEANGPITGYVLRLSRPAFGGRIETHTLPGNTQSFRKDGLTAYEPILISIAAATDQGLGPFSQEYTFFTSQSPPSAPESITNILNDKPLSLTILWREPKSINGLLQGYQVVYVVHVETSLNDDQTEGPFVVNTTADTHNITLRNLTAGVYDIKVRALNGAGYGDYSSTLALIRNTGPTEPLGTPDENINILTIVIPVAIILIIVVITIVIIGIVLFSKYRTSNKARIYSPPVVVSTGAGANDNAYELPTKSSEPALISAKKSSDYETFPFHSSTNFNNSHVEDSLVLENEKSCFTDEEANTDHGHDTRAIDLTSAEENEKYQLEKEQEDDVEAKQKESKEQVTQQEGGEDDKSKVQEDEEEEDSKITSL